MRHTLTDFVFVCVKILNVPTNCMCVCEQTESMNVCYTSEVESIRIKGEVSAGLCGLGVQIQSPKKTRVLVHVRI